MEQDNSDFIHVTKDLNPVLDELASRLFQKSLKDSFHSLEECKDWIHIELQKILFPADLIDAIIQYNEPKLQITKSGPLKDLSYAAPKKKKPYAKRLPKTEFIQTPDREKQQNKMTQANIVWKSLTTEQQNQWELKAPEFNLGGIHLFRGVYIFRLVDQLSLPDPFLPTDDLISYYRTRK